MTNSEIQAKLFERRVRELCRKKGFTLKGLAQEAGVGRETVYRMFRDRQPNYGTLSKVAAVLDVTPGQLLEGGITENYNDNVRYLMDIASDLNDEALFRLIHYAKYERDAP